MKPSILITACMVMASTFLYAQTVPYNAVFDITTKDTTYHRNLIRWIDGIIKETPDAKLEVVLYGKSLDMVTKDKSIVADEVKEFAKKKDIAFKVCAIAMKKQNLDKSQLLEGVQVVPDGVYEILVKQKQGYGYIKVTN